MPADPNTDFIEVSRGPIDKLKELLPANRIAAIVSVLTGIGLIIASFKTNLVAGSPSAEPLANAAGYVAGALLILKTVSDFLHGSQKVDQQEHEVLLAEIKGEVNNEEHDPEVDGDVPTLDEDEIDDGAAAIDDAGEPPEGDTTKFAGK